MSEETIITALANYRLYFNLGIFLIIVGRPGSSKSLSVEILKLVLSPGNYELRNSLGDLPAITELYFQCSPLSTSSGFKALFESAQKLSVDPKTMLAMVRSPPPPPLPQKKKTFNTIMLNNCRWCWMNSAWLICLRKNLSKCYTPNWREKRF